MTLVRKKLGAHGEDLAEKYLLKHGYEVLKRNYRNKIGEIDVLAKEGAVYCFVEVKLKTGNNYGSPEEMVDKRKQKKLIRTAEYYFFENEIYDPEWRIDVVAVKDKDLRLIKNAVEREFK